MEKFVAVGLDGFLANLEGFVVEYLESAHPRYAHLNREQFAFAERYPKDVFLDTLRFTENPNVYYALDRDKYAVRFLSEISESFGVLLVTSRPESAKRITETWLKRNLGSELYGSLLGVKFTLNKSALLFPMRDNLAFLIDDNPEEVLEAQKLGMTAYSWVQPWNEHIFPKVFVTRDGYTMYQENEYTDPVHFWGEERE